MVARLLVLLSNPLPCEKGVNMLLFLQHFAAFIEPSLNQLWDVEMPRLVGHLKVVPPRSSSRRFAGQNTQISLPSCGTR